MPTTHTRRATAAAVLLAAVVVTVTSLVATAPAASARQPTPAIAGMQPPSAMPNEDFDVWVTGFVPGEYIEVHFGGDVAGWDVADGNGEALVNTVVPSMMPPGDHPIEAVGDQNSWAGGTYTVDPTPPCDPAQSYLTAIRDAVGTAGDPLDVEGRACANEDIEVWLDGVLIGATWADPYGDFYAMGSYPSGIAPGDHPLDIVGSRGTSFTEIVTVPGSARTPPAANPPAHEPSASSGTATRPSPAPTTIAPTRSPVTTERPEVADDGSPATGSATAPSSEDDERQRSSERDVATPSTELASERGERDDDDRPSLLLLGGGAALLLALAGVTVVVIVRSRPR